MNISAINNLSPVYKPGSNVTPPRRYLSKQENDTFEYSEKAENQLNNTAESPIKKENSRRTTQFDDTISILNSIQSQAERTFNKHIAQQGWCGRVADKISTLWGSKNRTNILEDDLNKSRAEIENLQRAACEGNFKSEFFKTFGVNYDEQAVKEFEQQSQQYTLTQASEQMADFAEKSLSKHIKFFAENADTINPESPKFNPGKKIPDIATKMEEYEKDLAKFVGGKENLQKLANTKRNDFICLSREDKIEVYNDIAEGLIYTYRETANKLKHGKSDKEIKKEYDKAYSKAFGTTNNIQKRVSNYVKAQQIRTTAVSDLAVSGMIGAAIAITGTTAPALLGAGLTTASYIGLDLSELATNKIDNSKDLNKENVKDIIKCSLISGAEYLIGTKMYDIIPSARTGKKIIDNTLDVARTLGIELSVAFASEYLQTGEWATYQMNPKAFIKLTLATFAAEELIRMGLSAPAGLKSQHNSISQQTLDTISDAANKELQKQFAANPVNVMNLKLISVQNPDLFKELIASTLKEISA